MSRGRSDRGPEVPLLKRAQAVDYIAVGVAGLSVVLAFIAFAFSYVAAERQEDFQRDVEERQSAPFLVPGVPVGERGKYVDFYPEAGGKIAKRADRLLVVETPARIIVPVRNAGEGVAIMLGERFQLPDSCDDDAIADVDPPTSTLGYYAVSPGESEQLGSLPRKDSELADRYREAFGATQVFVLLRYTDVHRNKLRWTCISYTRQGTRGGWSLDYPVYGEAPWSASVAGG